MSENYGFENMLCCCLFAVRLFIVLFVVVCLMFFVVFRTLLVFCCFTLFIGGGGWAIFELRFGLLAKDDAGWCPPDLGKTCWRWVFHASMLIVTRVVYTLTSRHYLLTDLINSYINQLFAC